MKTNRTSIKSIFLMLLAACLLLPAFSSGEDMDLSAMTPGQLRDLQSRIANELVTRPEEYDGLVADAFEVLKAGWQEEYEKYAVPGMTYSLDIRGVRVIRIKDSLEQREAAYFGDVQYVVEFLFYDDYYCCPSGLAGSNAGYLAYSGFRYSVVVDRKGQMSLAMDPFRLYSTRTYTFDFSLFIDEVTDYGTKYNRMIEFSF